MDRIKKRLSEMVSYFSKNSWFVRLMNLREVVERPEGDGVIMIQIDGLSYRQLEKAMANGRTPFVQKLIKSGKYSGKLFYSGIPSSTPAVMGELFYGVKTCVPAFEFFDREDGKRKAMFQPAAVRKVARRIEKGNTPLLKGGSAYSTLFSGGARVSYYCTDGLTIESMIKALNPFKILLLLIFHIDKIIRVAAYSIVESVLAVTDFFRGIFTGRNFRKEAVFIMSRIFICIVLRELVRFRVKMDIARGMPIISFNLLGYDEQAHRRGPNSRFAHWTLKGVDDVVKDVFRTADRSCNRNYTIFLFSDHGQEAVASYFDRFNGSPKDAVKRVFADSETVSGAAGRKEPDRSSDYLYYRSKNKLFSGFNSHDKDTSRVSPEHIEITTMGPLGHVYILEACSEEYRSVFAENLVKKAGFPLVIFKKDGRITAINASGRWDLFDDKDRILGKDHPFGDQVVEDLSNVCEHPNAGDVIVSGWDPVRTPLTFSIENGAHGGIGKEETRAFVLLPDEIKDRRSHLRPIDLREIVLQYLSRQDGTTEK